LHDCLFPSSQKGYHISIPSIDLHLPDISQLIYCCLSTLLTAYSPATALYQPHIKAKLPSVNGCGSYTVIKGETDDGDVGDVAGEEVAREGREKTVLVVSEGAVRVELGILSLQVRTGGRQSNG
jgi:hypothetical protein